MLAVPKPGWRGAGPEEMRPARRETARADQPQISALMRARWRRVGLGSSTPTELHDLTAVDMKKLYTVGKATVKTVKREKPSSWTELKRHCHYLDASDFVAAVRRDTFAFTPQILTPQPAMGFHNVSR